MIIKEHYLVILTTKNKIQQVWLKLDHNEESNFYQILRTTGLYNGKQIIQPSLTIEKGKVKRTVEEQAILQYNAILKKYLDKGYTKLDRQDLSEIEIKSILGNNVTDQSGIPKPMLAKLASDCKSTIWNTPKLVSRKLDGVRMILYYKDGEILSATRGGGNYNNTTIHIRTSPDLLQIFKNKPSLILDGELYRHSNDWPLQRISGLARLKEWKEECNQLQYWIFDIIDSQSSIDRYNELLTYKEQLTNPNIIILEQKLITGYDNIKAEHDLYVQEGFEGLCARNPDKEYGIDKRSGDYLIKFKERQDAEALIIDVKEGLRPEDMCFILQMTNGITFAAKPIGTVEQRLEYLNNKEKYIGQQMTYTYFSLSTDGVPTQPVAKHIRPNDE